MAVTKEEVSKLITQLEEHKAKAIEEIDNLVAELNRMVEDTEASKKEATTENTN